MTDAPVGVPDAADAEPIPRESSLTAEAYNAFVAIVSLVGIDIVAQSSERTGSGDAASTRFEVDEGYQVVDGALHYRFNGKATLLSEDETEIGYANAAVVVTIATPEIPDQEVIEHFGATSAPMMAHPYVREAIATAAQRVGFHGPPLPIIVHQPNKN